MIAPAEPTAPAAPAEPISSVTPFQRVIEPDLAKIRVLENVLVRLRAGEQFSAIAIITSDREHYEFYSDGPAYEIMAAAERLAHRMHLAMDMDLDAT